MKKYDVGILGCTGMVGKKLVSLIQNHPIFNIKILAASNKSAGKTYGECLKNNFSEQNEFTERIKNIIVLDAIRDCKKIVKKVDFVFSAVNLSSKLTKSLEEKYAKLECPVISNNSANRNVKDVPMIIPELNYNHSELIDIQKRRLNTKIGFIATKSNCSIQSYVPALYPLKKFGINSVLVSTYQAVSGMGKTINQYPEIQDNIIPFIKGEEEKSETEPLKIFAELKNKKLIYDKNIKITSQCLRVPVNDGHLATVFVKFNKKPKIYEILDIWDNFESIPYNMKLFSAPKKFLHYFNQENMPQTKLNRDLEKGMAISIGRLREDKIFDYKFVCLSHNTIRGAAGGAILMAELLEKQGYLKQK